MISICCLAALSAQTSSPDLLIEHVTIVDCSEKRPRTDMTVVLHEGRIKEIRRSRKSDDGTANRVDGAGKFLIPGLWDMHVHATGVPGFAGIYLANGVTGVRDMFDPNDTTFALRAQAKTGAVLSPHIWAAGKIIDGPKPIWLGSLTASTAEEGAKAVDASLAAGADFIKVYSLLPREAFLGIVAESKKKGVTFVGHVPEMVSAWDASDAGMRSMEHLYGILRACSPQDDAPDRINQFSDPTKRSAISKSWLDSFDPAREQRLFAKLRKNRTYQTPTFTVLFSMSHPFEERADEQNRFDYMPFWMKGVFDTRNSPRFKSWTKNDLDIQGKVFEKDLQLVGDMNRAGVPILAGTDVMNPYCFPGFSLHDELAWLVKAGLTPLQALRAATLTGAEFFGVQKDYGTVQQGKVADLVLLRANPLEDIHNTAKIDAVVLGGKLLTRLDLDKLMPKTAKTASTPPPGMAAFGNDGD